MKKEPGINLGNPRKRELSSFMAEQLLYDYVTKQIDPLREKAVLTSLQDSPELTKSMDDIIYGMTYCHHLQKTSMAPEFIQKFKAPLNFKSRLKKYRNLRHWNQSTVWILEALVLSSVVLVLSIAVPWTKYIKLFLDQQSPTLTISEIPRDASFSSKQPPIPTGEPNPIIEYKSVAELFTVNPDFTINKLTASLPRLGASIEHQSLKPSTKGVVTPFLRISIPTSQTEALFSELKSQGQLTWLTPPSDNEKGSKIFGMELWVVKQEPPKGTRPPKDKNGE